MDDIDVVVKANFDAIMKDAGIMMVIIVQLIANGQLALSK